MAKIQLNGKKISIKSNFSLFELLQKYNLSNKKIAVEHNGKIVPKTSFKYRDLAVFQLQIVKNFDSAHSTRDYIYS